MDSFKINEKIASNSLFNTIAHKYPVGSVSIIDAQFNLLYVKGNDLELLPFDPHHFIGKSIFDFVPSHLKEILRNTLNSVLKNEELNIEYQFNNQWYEFNFMLLPVETKNNISQILITSKNITFNKEFQAKQDSNLLLMQGLLNTLNEGIILINLTSSDIAFVNQKTLALLDTNKNEIRIPILNQRYNLNICDSFECFEKKIEKNSVSKEKREIVLNDCKYYYEFNIKYFHFNMQFYCLVSIADITANEEKSFALEKQKKYFEQLFQGNPLAIAILDKQDIVIDINDAFKKLFGWESHEIQGNLLDDFIVPERLMNEATALSQLSLFGLNSTTETLRKNKANQEIDVILQGSPIVIDGNLEAIFGIYTDISSIKTYEKSLLAANEQLIKTNKELDRFVYSASHDLRAPLASILGLINIAKNEKDINAIQSYLDLMVKSVTKLDLFLNQISSYTRNAQTDLEIVLIEIEDVIKDAFDNFKWLEKRDKISLKTQIEASSPYYNDINRIKVILNNLISNSIKYANLSIENPSILVSATIDKNNMFLTISDNGIGIDEKYINNVFNMFFRANFDNQGTGIGLFIVKETVEKLRGTINLQSKVGAGTTFKITLPNLLAIHE